MKVILDISDNRKAFFMELIKSLDYIKIITEIKDKKRSAAIEVLAEAFNEVELHEKGKKKMKSAKSMLDEL